MNAIAVRIVAQGFDPDAESAQFRAAHALSGGVVTFTGQMREDSPGARLMLEHYPGYTDREVERLAREAARRFDLDGVSIIHRVGEMAPGAAIVHVAAAAAHRRAAFEAVDFLMDYLKSEAPFWKREWSPSAPDGWRWIEPRPEDHADKKRWCPDGGN